MSVRRKNCLKLLLILPVIAAILFSSIIPLQSHAAYNNEVEFKSDIVYMISLDQHTTIFNKNASKKTPMASLTKITTALVVLDTVKDLNKKVTVTEDEVKELMGTNSSVAGLVPGEVFTVKELLSLMLIKSANDAAVVLAHEVAGSTDNFVVKMNQFAKARGCKNTHYMNPHGLDTAGHYTTAIDLSKIIQYGLKNSTFKQIVAQPYYECPKTNKREAIRYPNTNSLLIRGSSSYYKPCRGIKTGTTDSAGYCLASYATKNGYTYLCIIISGPQAYAQSKPKNIAFSETRKAYDWAFDNIRLKVVADPSDVVTVVHVNLARNVDHVRLVPAKEVTALIPSNVDASGVSLKLIPSSLPENIHAPIKEGQVIGKAQVLYAGDPLTTVDLAAAEDVKQSFFGSIGYGIKRFFSFTATKVILILLVVFGLIYWLVDYLYKKKNKENRVNTVRIKSDVKGNKPVRLITTDYGKKTKQPKPRKNMVGTYDEKHPRSTTLRSPYSSKKYNNASHRFSGWFKRKK